jgi:predicted MFS family arabinose efflux permease
VTPRPGRRGRGGGWPGWRGAVWALTLLGLAATAWLDCLLLQAGLPELT